MGSCLHFETRESVAARDVEEILAHASELCAQQPWLDCDPLLPRVEEDGRLSGWSRIHPQPVVGDDADGEHDLWVLLETLKTWSREYQQTWTVQIDDRRLGAITHGSCDSALHTAFDCLVAAAKELSAVSARTTLTRPTSSATQLRLFDPDKAH